MNQTHNIIEKISLAHPVRKFWLRPCAPGKMFNKLFDTDSFFTYSNIVTLKLKGTALCCCSIYLLKWDEKLVISDIDGTITKSEVLGHVMPAFGMQKRKFIIHCLNI